MLQCRLVICKLMLLNLPCKLEMLNKRLLHNLVGSMQRCFATHTLKSHAVKLTLFVSVQTAVAMSRSLCVLLKLVSFSIV